MNSSHPTSAGRVFFDEWEISSATGKLRGWRGGKGGGGATEGHGLYLAKTPERAQFFGSPIRAVEFDEPKRTLLVKDEILYILFEDEAIMAPIAAADSEWTRFNKRAREAADVTDSNWGSRVEQMTAELTKLIREAGYDSVLVRCNGGEWTILLAAL